mgnify:CR=1 FL=1
MPAERKAAPQGPRGRPAGRHGAKRRPAGPYPAAGRNRRGSEKEAGPMQITIRGYESRDLPLMVAIWNEVVEEAL